jgi:hypothetical protein
VVPMGVGSGWWLEREREWRREEEGGREGGNARPRRQSSQRRRRARRSRARQRPATPSRVPCPCVPGAGAQESPRWVLGPGSQLES